MRRGLLVFLAWLAGGIIAAAAGEPARVEVATLDGGPVYHWRVFESGVRDDVDRALILREFGRRKYQLSSKLLDDAVARAVTEQAGGDAGKFADKLRRKGATMEDFRLFTSEEMILSAMRYRDVPNEPPSEWEKKQEQWLAGLRAGAVVKRLPTLRR